VERELQVERPTAVAGDGPGPEPDEVERLRAEAAAILDVADRVLASIHPVDAESYLQQNRQRGGE
jgi:hypothetical protein